MIKEIRFSEEDACKARMFNLQRSMFRSAEGRLQGKNVQCSTFNVQRSMFNVLGLKVPHPTKPGLYLTGGKIIAVTRQ